MKSYHCTTFNDVEQIPDWLNEWEFMIDPRSIHIVTIPLERFNQYTVIYKANKWIGAGCHPTEQQKKEALYT